MPGNQTTTLHCDVLIAGGGVGGVAAALSLARLGSRNVPWWAAMFSGIATIVSAIAYLGAPGVAIYAPALVVQQMFGVSIWIVVLFVGLFTTAYTLLGGIKAVIWTDSMQLFVLIGGLCLGFATAITLGFFTEISFLWYGAFSAIATASYIWILSLLMPSKSVTPS